MERLSVPGVLRGLGPERREEPGVPRGAGLERREEPGVPRGVGLERRVANVMPMVSKRSRPGDATRRGPATSGNPWLLPPRHGTRALHVIAGLAALAIAVAVPVPAAHAQATEPVTVERLRPKKAKYPTLRFLRENRDFIRARYDLLRQRPGGDRGEAGELDPRFLAYQEMLRDLFSAQDSVVAQDDSLARRQLLASITDLGRLEDQLDVMDRVLAEQRTRLGVLQADFTGRQRTALIVVLSGYPSSAGLDRVTVTLEDGDTLTVPLTDQHRASLRKGGVVQVFHGFVEPREQVVEVAIIGERWPRGDKGYVKLDPARDRLTLLRLDLSSVKPAEGAGGIQASKWLHDARLHSGGD